jgi:hypothetical protein
MIWVQTHVHFAQAMDRKKHDQLALFEQMRKEREQEMEQTRARNEAVTKAKRFEEQQEIVKVSRF